ncbi:MAG TPA: protein disulfide oxidoreductase [Campylobacteraceae bacterium]|nr:protein disulfide oxidoreductase [Campylobacteraceae bacterium]
MRHGVFYDRPLQKQREFQSQIRERDMKKFTFSPKSVLIEVAKLLVMLFIVANVVSYLKKPEVVDQTLPNLNVTLPDGTARNLESYAGKPLLLYFWGSWCPICKMSSPVISDLSQKYQVVAVAVNSGSDKDLKSYMQAHDLHFPAVNDADGAIAQKFGVDTFPTTFIYNSKGSLIFTDVGYTSKPSLLLKIWLGDIF